MKGGASFSTEAAQRTQVLPQRMRGAALGVVLKGGFDGQGAEGVGGAAIGADHGGSLSKAARLRGGAEGGDQRPGESVGDLPADVAADELGALEGMVDKADFDENGGHRRAEEDVLLALADAPVAALTAESAEGVLDGGRELSGRRVAGAALQIVKESGGRRVQTGALGALGGAECAAVDVESAGREDESLVAALRVALGWRWRGGSRKDRRRRGWRARPAREGCDIRRGSG